MDEIRRHTEAQSARCKNLMKKLRTIQLEELEEYGEEQLESAVKTICHQRGIKLKEAKVPDFLVRKKSVPPLEEQDEEELDPSASKETTPTQRFDTKLGLEQIRDVTQSMRKNIKETLFSSVMFGNDNDETDSGSEYEDEVEIRARVIKKRRRRQQFQGYLPVELNPATKWARQRHEFITRWMWLIDALRNINYRLHQQDELLRYITTTKPKFKFEAQQICTSPPPGARTDNKSLHISKASVSEIAIFQELDKSYELNKRGIANVVINTPFGIGSCTGKMSAEEFIKLRPEAAAQIHANNARYRKPGMVGGGLESLNLNFPNVIDPGCVASRCMPVLPFRQRKIFQLGGIHNVMGKSVRKPTTLCNCFGRTELCAVCSGRSDKIKPVRNGAMTQNDISALLDHTYHKVLSCSEEKPVHRMIESALKTEEWNKQSPKKHIPLNNDYCSTDDDSSSESEAPTKVALLPVSPTRPKPSVPKSSVAKVIRKSQYNLKPPKEVSRKSRKRKRNSEEDDEDEDVDINWAPKKASTNINAGKKRRVDEKYDIDHIVIPYSIAAATRVEKIEYKEIMIPSWRANKVEPKSRKPSLPYSPRLTRHRRMSSDDDMFEDTSIEAITARHHRSEMEEKKRFLNAMNKMTNRRARRSESKADISELGGTSVSPIPTDIVEPSSTPAKVEEIPTSASNQISAADASLAVTALKINAASTNGGGVGRRRTISACKVIPDLEEVEECGYIPFEPRKFPLSEAEYAEMVNEMERAYEESEKNEVIKQEAADEEMMSDQENEVDDPDWRDMAI